jgi:hypothetical protein
MLLATVSLGRAFELSASASTQQAPSSAAQHEHEPGQTSAMPNMQDMMKAHQQMMAEMNAGDAKLDQLVQQMNAASGQSKINATAAVVTELVRQQRSMHQHLGQMHQEMMGGMMKR